MYALYPLKSCINPESISLLADGDIIQLITHPRVVINPVKDLRVPEQRVLGIENPVIFVRKVEETRVNALSLENVE